MRMRMRMMKRTRKRRMNWTMRGNSGDYCCPYHPVYPPLPCPLSHPHPHSHRRRREMNAGSEYYHQHGLADLQKQGKSGKSTGSSKRSAGRLKVGSKDAQPVANKADVKVESSLSPAMTESEGSGGSSLLSVLNFADANNEFIQQNERHQKEMMMMNKNNNVEDGEAN
ncbi:hypothetical protein K1719_006090 [Acacia pycnantha]|nr:hypothetical protein K1719_006090 [Acacia pycnantha]